jgi:hypothetical protein
MPDINVSPEWIAYHAEITAWLLDGCILALTAISGYLARTLWKAIQRVVEDIQGIKNLQQVQSANHLTHIEANTLETSNIMREFGAKMDVLISILEKRI